MFETPGLAVSLPARALVNANLPASLFAIADLAGADLPANLLAAIDLIEQECRRRKLPLVFIARPEIFIGAAPLAWLKDRLNGIRNHLCITDGSFLRVIPHMRNHMFHYCLAVAEAADAFARLRLRAPELLSTLGLQVNTAFTAGRRAQPPILALPPRGVPTAGETALYRFFLDRRFPERGVARSLAAGVSDPARWKTLSRVTYVPLNETSLHDGAFLDAIGSLLAPAARDPSSGIILGLPEQGTVPQRMQTVLAGLCAARSTAPRMDAENIAFATGDPAASIRHDGGPAIDCIAHAASDFWRQPPKSYAAYATMTVHAPNTRRQDGAPLRTLLRSLLGRDPTLRWRPDADAS